MIKAYRVGRERIATTQLSAVTMAPYRSYTRRRYSAKRRYRPRRVTRKRYGTSRFSKRRFGMRNRSYAMRKRYANRRVANKRIFKMVYRWSDDKQFAAGVYSDCLSMNAQDINSMPGNEQLKILFDQWKPGKKYVKSFIPFEKYGNETTENAVKIIRWSCYDADAQGRKLQADRAVSDMQKVQGSKWKIIAPRQVVSCSFQPVFQTRSGVNTTGNRLVDNPWRDCVTTQTSETCHNGVQQVWTCNTGTTLTIKNYYAQVFYFKGMRVGTQYGNYEPINLPDNEPLAFD
uniref:Coat protein n=1 Tax=Dragonfly larvae associated circular virus-10 TaxID=1454022 RepID=A0A140AQS1_9VIRU|nr:coat protein [Dragonfly larvae associated circular virus-10]